MPKFYRNAFYIPTGQDPADLPKIFEKFIDSGIIGGSVIAHFESIAVANKAISDNPTAYLEGAFAWIRAALYRSTGAAWVSVPMATLGYHTSFATEGDRNAFYIEGSPTGAAKEGQLAVVGTWPNVKLTMFVGNGVWSDHTDLMIRNHNLEGDHDGNTVCIGDPNNPFKLGGTGFRKENKWAVNLAGNSFVDGDFHISNGNFNIVKGNHTINGTRVDFNAPVYLNGAFTAAGDNTIRGRLYAGAVSAAGVNANGFGPYDQSNTARVDYYGVGVFNNGVWFLQNMIIVNGLIIQNNGVDASGANSFIRGNLWVTGTTITAGLQYSDRRLKRDIVRAPSGALDTVKAIPVQSFSMSGRKSMFGWVAQDVKEMLPTAVTEMDNAPEEGRAPVMEAADGSSLATVMTLDVTEMTATLWKAVQELSAEVENLRSQVGSPT